MRHDGSFLPLWCELGRRIARRLASAPKNVQLLERVADAQDLWSICGSLSEYQPPAFRALVALFAFSGFMVPVGLSFVALRFTGKCGGDRIQVITPIYADLYNGHCAALGSFTVAFIIINVILVGFAFGIENSMREASSFYAKGMYDIESYFRDRQLQPSWNGSQIVVRDAALHAKRLSADFNRAFKQYLFQKLEANPPTPKEGRCGKLLRAVLDENDGRLNTNCATLEEILDELVKNATKSFKKKTVLERRRLARALWVRAFEASGGNDANVKNLATAKLKLKRFEKKLHLRKMFGILAPRVMIAMSMILGVVAALLVVGLAMGMLNHDRGMAPTLRNSYSHRAGLIMLYSPILMLLSSVVAIPLAGILLSGCIVGECYICEPYRGKQRFILDEAVTKLLSSDTALSPSKILQTCSNPVSVPGQTPKAAIQSAAHKKHILASGKSKPLGTATENCSTEGKDLFQQHSADDFNGTFLQPELSDFYGRMIVQAETMLSTLADHSNQTATLSECNTVYRVMRTGYEMFCVTMLGNYHGSWMTLLLLSFVLIATSTISLRLSRFYLVMEHYCYAGWDERILRKAPRRKVVWTKGQSPQASVQLFARSSAATAKDDTTRTEFGLKQPGSLNGSLNSDEQEAINVWPSEAWLTGSISKEISPVPLSGSGMSKDCTPKVPSMEGQIIQTSQRDHGDLFHSEMEVSVKH